MLSFDDASAQQYSSVLILDPLPLTIKTGDDIIFSGQLLTASGYAISDATVYINDNVRFSSDDVLGSVTTDENGEFEGVMTAVLRSSGAWDFFLTYDGAPNVSSSRSVTYSVIVSDYADSNSSGLRDIPTSIIFDKIPSSAYAGDSMTFTGKLYADGSPFPNAYIQILEDDPALPDDFIASGYTDSNGNFKITWNIDTAFLEKDFDIYAVFDGDSLYDRDRSANQIISILKHSGSIKLDPIPSSAKIGEPITFSGSLSLNTGSPEGAIVYIKDEDLLNPDDLLATAWVDANGKFSVIWYATNVDEDYEADIYAVFEGNDVYYRLTTCDSNPTRSFGGMCLNTNPLYISGIYNSPSSPPPDYSGEYMEGFYSLNFAKTPLIAIVPTPDAYVEAARHIGSVQEGILMWESYLDGTYGGDWNVDFDVVSSDDLFFSGKPDVIVNLVTPEMKSECVSDFLGWSMISKNPVKPIQAYVCISSEGKQHSTKTITATSAHEFIHAVGLGHAWNKKGDLMCSGEKINGQWIDTCPTSYFGESKTPSALNLAGVVELYGTDGFVNPNKHVPYKTKFISGSNYYDQANVLQNDQPSTSPSAQPQDNNEIINEKTTIDVEIDRSIPTIQPEPNVNLDETFEELYDINKNTKCGHGSTLVNGYCIMDQLAKEIAKTKDTSDSFVNTVEPVVTTSNLIKLELYADGDSAGNYIATDVGKPIQFVGTLVDDKGEPVKNSIVNIIDKQTGVSQTSGVAKGMGNFIILWKTEANFDNLVEGKSKWEFVATSNAGSKTVTSESVILVVTDPTFIAEKIPDKVELPKQETVVLENNEVIEEKLPASEPVKQIQKEPKSKCGAGTELVDGECQVIKEDNPDSNGQTCFLFWCW